MKQFFIPALLALWLGGSSIGFAKVEHLLPQPKSVTLTNGGTPFTLSGAVSISDATGNTLLQKFFTDHGMTIEEGASLTVKTEKVESIDDAYDYTLAGYGNEAYQLTVTDKEITIHYIDSIGVTRAAQSLSQLAEGYDGTAQVEALTMTDWPSFKLRGYMHDVGRSFISAETIKKHIDLLSHFKVNTFHWHLTENQAWRFEVKAYPKLTDSSITTRFPGSYYTQEQCREIEEYAWERGVIVIPEIDMPGHSGAFQRALGFTMQSDEGKVVLKKILDEVATVFTRAPYIHIGADEETTTADYVNEMVGYVRDSLHLRCAVWNPIKGVSVSDVNADMAQLWGTSGSAVSGKANIDCRYNYTNHFDVFADLVGIYKSTIYYKTQGDATVAGTISACWNDRKLETEDDIIQQNNFYANVIASSTRAWIGGGEKYIDNCTNGGTNGGGGVMLPNSGSVYDDFKDWETRFLYHKANLLKDEPIPYVKQTNVRWRISDAFPNDGDVTTVFPPEEQMKEESLQPETYTYKGTTYGSGIATGAGIYLRHTWGQSIINAFYTSPAYNTTAYAWTYVYSPKEQTVGAQIEFQNYSRSESDPAPAAGNWDLMGSKIWINGEEVAAPTYDNTGVSISSKEVLQKNENFTGRSPISVTLKEGWNKVFLKLPYINAAYRLDKWMFTCVFTDAEGKAAVDGLVYSPGQCIDEAAETIAAQISDIKSYRRSMVSDEPGYYPESTAEELDQVVAEVEATLSESKTEEERSQQATTLENALEAFKTKLADAAMNQPQTSTDEKLYAYTLSTPLRGTRYATSSGAGTVLTGSTTVTENAYWKFVSRTDGAYDIVNCVDGSYISPVSSYNSAISTTTTSPEKGWNIKAANEVGYMIITSDYVSDSQNVQLNQTNFTSGSNYTIYNWGGGANTSDAGCKYRIHSVDIAEVYVTVMDGEGTILIDRQHLLLPTDEEISATSFSTVIPAGYSLVSFSQEGNTYTLTVKENGVPTAGNYYYFYNKHMAGDCYFYDNDGSVGFSTTKEEGNKAYIWKCEANGNQLSLVNLSTGRYFAWKALSTSAYAWTIDATVGTVGVNGVVNEGCVTLYGASYLVIKNASSFDQASRAGYYNATYSSDFAFEKCDPNDETSVGIHPLTSNENQNADIYNLHGKRVKAADRGVYIINGQKVWVTQ